MRKNKAKKGDEQCDRDKERGVLHSIPWCWDAGKFSTFEDVHWFPGRGSL